MKTAWQMQTISPEQRQANRRFLQIVGLGSFWLVVSLVVVWRHLGEILVYLYTICQADWSRLSQQLPTGFHLLVSLVLLALIARASLLLGGRLRATQRFKQTLRLRQIPISPRLAQAAGQAGLAVEDLICIDVPGGRAFSLGLWQPKVWLSTGLLNLLPDAELIAVLHHEAHHRRQYDPLRLLLSRLISDSFFFIPILPNLSDQYHLAQEMAADVAAIERMADVLPLASALHKLLTVADQPWSVAGVAISQLTITERRISALVAPGLPQPSRPSWLRWLISSGVALVLMATIFVSGSPAQPMIATCGAHQNSVLPLNLSNMSEVPVR